METILPKIVQLFFTDKCYEEFFYNLNFSNVECLKQSISKALGVGIIVGSTLVKLPQIIKISNAKSSEGVSFAAVVLELVALTSSASYSYAKSYPFSSWGESLFLLVETAIIGFLVLVYAGKARGAYSFTAVYSMLTFLLFSGLIPMSMLVGMQMINLPIVLISKMIQAVKNYQNGHTGQLSPITVFLIFLGSCARIFTSIQETGDPIIITTFMAASMANGVLAAQILYYKQSTAKVLKAQKKD